MQRAPGELSESILDQMDFTTSEKRKGYRYLPPNRGTRLRTLYGNLTRALIPGGKGNISTVTANGQNVIDVEFGFDPGQKVKQGKRVGDLRYGLVHENGGTIQHPGGTAYVIIKGKARFVTNAKAAQYAAKGRTVKRTKAHSIKIPKRPFLRPGIEQYLRTGFPALLDELTTDVMDELNNL